MADQPSQQERTEPPTQRRREEARQEGRIPRSAELSAAAVLLAGTGTLAAVGATALAHATLALFVTGASWISAGPMEEGTAAYLLRSVTMRSLIAFVPFAIGLAGIVLIVNAIQARGVFSATPIKAKWENVSPLSGLKRIFSMQSVATFLKSVAKLGLLGLVAYWVLRGAWEEILALGNRTPAQVLSVMRAEGLQLALVTGFAFLAIALADYLFQYRQHEVKLRMTKQEAKDELKQTEGDPMIKSRIRAARRALLRRQMLRSVETADVVLTNPTEIAVALKYDPLESSAPIAVAMGQRKLAARIRAIALACGVPVVENRPLARALFATATVGAPIPPALYVAVAEVLAFVYRQRSGYSPVPAGHSAGRA